MVKATAAVLVPLVALPLFVILLVLGVSGGGSGTAVPSTSPAAAITAAGGGAPSANMSLRASLAAGYGWTGQQDGCLDELWTRESGWREDAINPTSGAYGIAQALGHAPGATLAMNRAGDNYPPPYTAANRAPYGDSDAAAQISWGLGDIKSVYGTPCAAWLHEEEDGFY